MFVLLLATDMAMAGLASAMCTSIVSIRTLVHCNGTANDELETSQWRNGLAAEAMALWSSLYGLSSACDRSLSPLSLIQLGAALNGT